MIEINDNEETVTCRICGENHRRLYGNHFKYTHNGMTAKEYRKMFTDAPITVPGDMKNTTKNGGKHMKQEKYRKMFSEMFSGENNPNHKNNTTEQERKERSPICIEFYDKNYPNLTNIERKELLDKHVKEKVKDRLLPSNVEYWVNKGYNKEEAKQKVTESQTTFSKEICIEKYGEKDGLIIWKERQKKWQKSINENGGSKGGYSLISQELFDHIIEKYSDKVDMDKIYYATKNKEYFISKKGGIYLLYDFVDLNSMKIIEFHGDSFHGNPKKFKPNDYPHPYYKENGPTANDMWEMDLNKKNIAESKGFEVFVVWESDYMKDKNKVLETCLNFLKI